MEVDGRPEARSAAARFPATPGSSMAKSMRGTG